MTHLVVFASGSGTNFQAIIDAVEAGKIPAVITGLLTNKREAKAVKRAEKHGIPVRVLSDKDYDDQQQYVNELLSQLEAWSADLLVLAGYMRKIPEPVVATYRNRIVNIHPSLLPKYGGKGFYGDRVHRAVLEAGEKETGVTVHLVDEEYDRGPVLEQRKVEVKDDDTVDSLAFRIHKTEHQLYPEVLARFIREELT